MLPLGRLVVVSTLLATAVACGRDRPPPDAQATSVAPEIVPTTAAPTTPTTAPLGEQVGTVAGAQRLLDLFAHLDGEAARMLLQKGAPDAEFDQALQAVYVGQELSLAQGRFAGEASAHFYGYARPQPDIAFKTKSIIDARRNDCVVVSGTADLRPRYTNPVPVVDGIFVMVVETGISPSRGNPTRWRLLVVGEPEAGTDLQAICPGL